MESLIHERRKWLIRQKKRNITITKHMTSIDSETSPAIATYIDRSELVADNIILQAQSLAALFDIKDPVIRCNLDNEAIAFACHYMEAFAEETPEMLLWAKHFTKRLESKSSAAETFENDDDFSAFFNNRRNYYKYNKVGFQTDTPMFNSVNALIHYALSSQDPTIPNIIMGNQNAIELLGSSGCGDQATEVILGVNSASEDYMMLIAKWLTGYTELLANNTVDTSLEFLKVMQAEKQSQGMHMTPLNSDIKQRIYDKAIKAGLDPQKDPVGAWLANNCSIWALLFELSIICSLKIPGLVILSVILFACLLSACAKVSRYSGVNIVASVLMALLMAPLQAPFAIITKLGGLK